MSKLEDLKTGFFAITDENGMSDYYYVPNGDWDNVQKLGRGKEHKCYTGLYGYRFLLFKTCPEGSMEQCIRMYNNNGDCLFDGPVDAVVLDAKSDIFVVTKNGKMETKSLGCFDSHFEKHQRQSENFENRHRASRKRYVRMGALLVAFVSVAALLKGVSDNVREEKKSFQSAEATYLGNASGYALFDLDGNRQTIEAVGKITEDTTDKLVGKIGLTAKISEWAEQAKLVQMERVVDQRTR